MTRRLFAAALGVALFTLADPSVAPAQPKQKVDHPRLRAALHELREAREYLKTAKDFTWPPGHKERAQTAIDAAIQAIRDILAVKDVDTFVGVDRNPDYYKKYKDRPRLRAALEDVRDARDELKNAKADFGDKREEALDFLDMAAGDLVILIRFGKR